VGEHLKVFQEVRLPRNCITQIMSNYWSLEEAEMVEMLKPYCDPGSIPPLRTESHTKPLRDFFFQYDTYLEVERALRARAPDTRYIDV
jgi:hypothetical protein